MPEKIPEGAVLGKKRTWAPASFRYHNLGGGTSWLVGLTSQLLTFICPWQWQRETEQLGVGVERADQTARNKEGQRSCRSWERDGDLIPHLSPLLGTYCVPGDGLCPSFNWIVSPSPSPAWCRGFSILHSAPTEKETETLSLM